MSQCSILALVTLFLSADIAARPTETTSRSHQSPQEPTSVLIDGPPAPVPPEVMTRDADGRVTIRAIKLTAVISLDGQLDEAVYREVKPVHGFIQAVPEPGEPATERTDIWVLFDAENIYVTARCWQRDMARTLVANEMRRDQARQNDGLAVAFDTFYDRQTGIMFYTNPLGALGDGYVGEAPGSTNTDFNPLWDVRSGRFDGGWTAEMRVPFKSLRYRPGAEQVWGVQFRRVIRHRNETAFLTALPITDGRGQIGRLSYAATLVGIEAPPNARNLEFKPYGISRLLSDRTVNPAVSGNLTGDAGFDVKYGLTRNLTADLTVNTDFAQVEVDDQQVNLTRFNLLFPEKREFFLEGVGNFTFGGGEGGAPQIFYSRQIGLNRGRVVPILAGGRVTGKVGRFSVGALTIQTDDDAGSETPRTNFAVLRLKRDLFRRSAVGLIYTGRSESNVARGRPNQAYGVDGIFSFYDNLDLTGYYARTATPGLSGSQESYQGTFGFTPDTYGITLEHLFIGDDFNPEVGFVRRRNLKRSFVSGRVSPRTTGNPTVRRYVFEGNLTYIVNTDDLLESRDQQLNFQTEFHNSDAFDVSATRTFDRLLAPFRIAPGVTIPAGDYTFTNLGVGYALGEQKRWTGSTTVEYGTYYDGDRMALSFRSGRLAITPRLVLEPSLSINWIALPLGSFTTQLYRARASYSFSPRVFVASLLQYNSTNDAVSTNLRLRWEYIPGSELFVVYTDERPTDSVRGRFSDVLNRSLVMKINRLFRF